MFLRVFCPFTTLSVTRSKRVITSSSHSCVSLTKWRSQSMPSDAPDCPWLCFFFRDSLLRGSTCRAIVAHPSISVWPVLTPVSSLVLIWRNDIELLNFDCALGNLPALLCGPLTLAPSIFNNYYWTMSLRGLLYSSLCGSIGRHVLAFVYVLIWKVFSIIDAVEFPMQLQACDSFTKAFALSLFALVVCWLVSCCTRLLYVARTPQLNTVHSTFMFLPT